MVKMVGMVDDRWLRQQHAIELGSATCQPYSTVRGVEGTPNDLPPQDLWSSPFLFCLYISAAPSFAD